MRTRKELKMRAKETFDLNRSMFLIAGLLAIIASGVISFVSNRGAATTNNMTAATSGSLIASIVFIIIWFLVEIFYLGSARFYLGATKKEDVDVGTMFSFFPRLFQSIGLPVLVAVKIFLWSLLLFIPGIIAAYRYSQAYFIYSENPDMKASEAIDESIRIMNGQKWDLFVLHLSFIAWALLGVITFGIAMIYVYPYMNLTLAEFYIDVSGKSEAVIEEVIAVS